MPIYNFKCKECEFVFESIENIGVDTIKCKKCGEDSDRIFSAKGQNFNLKYDPKKDICDWQGNTSQYYRLYNEAKGRGENVRLPENGE